ncbi:hypothetical protein FHR70_003171 [Microvirga lupini]|uniref:HNH endonuclease n=1 Tax=Microvirga lupini TaxID=420324 RepID=A0A7W4YX36_9HYPH|nr:hypothetical protein [Microvirga lupini]MBB3020090.1 hypothetical protein [Microvirga lupini]
MAEGTCKLTGKKGKFVASHLIPKALTRPAVSGAPLIQFGSGRKPTRRWDSWYDRNLVIREGEDILTDLDTWAITELRKHRLVWSGWGPMTMLKDDHDTLNGTPWGIRRIKTIDTQRLRLFFLSLLWRAAATSRPEFSEIVMPPEDLERLRLMILQGTSEPLSFYPIALIQLSTVGEIHNQTPLADAKRVPATGDEPERLIPIFRFYLDGLIAHIHRQTTDDGYADRLGPLILGSSNEVVISTVTFERSFQLENFLTVLSESL